MMRLWVALLLLVAAPSWAEEPVPLKAAEIEALLSGNTISGSWNNRPYRQFFAANGMTLYLESGAPVSQGRWKTDGEAHQYCSEWGGSGAWGCYEILSQGDHYLWREADGSTESFTVLEGNQL